jgi:hypothetical protein
MDVSRETQIDSLPLRDSYLNQDSEIGHEAAVAGAPPTVHLSSSTNRPCSDSRSWCLRLPGQTLWRFRRHPGRRGRSVSLRVCGSLGFSGCGRESGVDRRSVAVPAAARASPALGRTGIGRSRCEGGADCGYDRDGSEDLCELSDHATSPSGCQKREGFPRANTSRDGRPRISRDFCREPSSWVRRL